MRPSRNCTSSEIVKKTAQRLPLAPDVLPNAVAVASTPVTMAAHRTQECRTRTRSCMGETLTHALARRSAEAGASCGWPSAAPLARADREVLEQRLGPNRFAAGTFGDGARLFERGLG